ncbi:MAG: putative porin [Bacteroidota bacterium]
MRSNRLLKKVLSLIVGLLLSFAANAQVQTPDSVFTTGRNSSLSSINDSSTFFNHFYQLILLGTDNYTYHNLGAETDYFLPGVLSAKSEFNSFNIFCQFPVILSKINQSHIGYLKGSKLEQAFSAGFSQRVFKYFTLKGDFRSINSPGFFINQQNKILNYHAAIDYKNRTGNYKINLAIHPTVINQQMNGGVVFDSLLDKITNNAGKSLEVNINDATIKYRNNDVRLKQKIVSHPSDSLNAFSFFLEHEIHYQTSSFIYNSTSANVDFYETVFFDSTTTSDSMHYYNLSNLVLPGFQLNTMAGKFESSLNLGIEESKYHVFDSIIIDNIYSIGINMILNSQNYNLKLSGLYKKSDVFDPSISANFLGNVKLNNGKIDLRAKVEYLDGFPSFFSSLYVSNHFIWSNKFRNQKTWKVSGGAFSSNNVWELSGNIYIIKDFIYYNSHAKPEQYDGRYYVTEGKVKFNFPVIGKWFIYSDTRFQKSTNEDIYRIPDIYTYSAVYHERFVFKNAMKISVGTGCYYFTSFMANALMPATSQFYLQDEVKIGNYPYFDFFLNFRIKTIDFFIKVEHLNEGLSGANSFYLPHQPSPGRTLKVGFNWVFNDNQDAIR